MKQIILGTAGHIDHGKTSLIRALTGVNTDRLKEEQERGITIELGFASLDLASGYHVGIVDVPGHEKFVKNMVAGATGIDLVVMVIAADEGVMPQTREHMEICTLLGIEHGFVVLTKIDLVDEEWLELATEDVQEFAQGTFLEGKPTIPVSASTGEGIDRFTVALEEACKQIPDRPATSLFRLPVDRVFTMRGFGTVITGTVASGRVRLGDTVMIYPSRATAKVRGIQVHNQSVEESEAGLRTAINFQGLQKSDVQRGEVLSVPGGLEPSYMVDLELAYLKSNPKAMKSRTRVRFHTGTNEIIGHMVLLDRDELKPGQSAYTQIRLEVPVALVKGDRFVIRSYSPIRTIGGGRVLDPIPAKHKRFRSSVPEHLEVLAKGSDEEVVLRQIEAAGHRGISFQHLQLVSGRHQKDLDKMLQGLLSKKTVSLIDREQRLYVHRQTADKAREGIVRVLEAYHRKHPLKGGMSKEELKSKVPEAGGGKLFSQVLSQMAAEETVAQEGDQVRLSGHRVSLAADQEDVRDKILDLYRERWLMPPYFKEIGELLGLDAATAKDVLMLLVDEGRMVKVKEDLYFHADALADLRSRLIDFLQKNEEITTPQFKDMTGASRKYVIPLLEYFDSNNVTLRIGDSRKMRKKT
ncbi:MAG: selenocysteine-specific translation elongation factor [Desulfobacterales bacterium]|nr:selenocysteine-specific translation elongation factor [Desulfobacterales bacterium]